MKKQFLFKCGIFFTSERFDSTRITFQCDLDSFKSFYRNAEQLGEYCQSMKVPYEVFDELHERIFHAWMEESMSS